MFDQKVSVCSLAVVMILKSRDWEKSQENGNKIFKRSNETLICNSWWWHCAILLVCELCFAITLWLQQLQPRGSMVLEKTRSQVNGHQSFWLCKPTPDVADLNGLIISLVQTRASVCTPSSLVFRSRPDIICKGIHDILWAFGLIWTPAGGCLQQCQLVPSSWAAYFQGRGERKGRRTK